MKKTGFEIYKRPYTIEYVDTIERENGMLLGECNSEKGVVTIATKASDGTEFKKRDVKLTYYHELTHAILNEGNYFVESDNEPLVEWIAKCLLDLSEQGVL